jgi:hypothetical protein
VLAVLGAGFFRQAAIDGRLEPRHIDWMAQLRNTADQISSRGPLDPNRFMHDPTNH